MTIGSPQGGGHIDTPEPERPTRARRPRRRIDTPDPVHETPPPVAPIPEPRYWHVRQRPNPYFMGQEPVLESLKQAIENHPVCHLLGPRGTGTSQTSLASAYALRGNYDAVFWVDGREPELFRLGLSRLADELGLSAREELPHPRQVALMVGWLRQHQNWLLLVDGCSETSHLDEVLQGTRHGRILLVGHTPLSGISAHVVEHPALDSASAFRIIRHRSGQRDETGLNALVHYFQGYTQALYLAAAYCHEANVSVVDYAARLDSLPDPASDDRRTSQECVNTAVTQTLRHLSDQDPAALALLALCSFLDAEDIPLVTLYDGAPFLPKRLSACVTEPESLNQTLSLLFRLGLIQFEQNSINVHPEVQSATRQLLGKEQANAWLMTALRVVLEAFPVESEYTHPIPACSILVRHALAVTRLSERADNLRESTGALLNQVGLYVHGCEEYELARTCFERAIAVAESLYGTTAHPTIAARTNSLGVVLQDQGNYAEARDCYKRAFALCEAIYGPARDAAMGPAHRSMLTMPSRNLCQVLELMGDIPAAKAAYAETIEIFIEVFCWNHSVVAECLNGLGQLHHHQDEHAQAQACFLRAIQSEENADEPVLGALAQYTRNLAHSLMEIKRYEEAIKFYEHALLCDRDDYGPVHETVANDLAGIARVHRARSRYEEAHQCLDEALAIWENLRLGPTVSKALLWRQKGRTFLDAYDDEDAIRCLTQALAHTEKAAGPDSPVLGPDYIYLARALGHLERNEEAEAALLKAYELQQTTPWMDPDGLNALYGRLVRNYRAQENYFQAAVFQEQVLQNDLVRFGEKDDRVGADAYALGNLYIALGEMEEAARFLSLADEIFTASRGPSDERTMRVRKKRDTVLELAAQRGAPST